MNEPHHELHEDPAAAGALPPEPHPVFSTDGADPDHNAAPLMHSAETVRIELAPYSLTREQVAERYAAAGFSVKPRTVSLYAQQGRLRARKVEARNGLERYLFDPSSVDEDIARRRREAVSYASPETVYAAANGAASAHEDDADGASLLPAPSLHAELHAREIRVAVLETQLSMERDARIRAERRADNEANRSLAFAQQLGEYKQRVAMLEAPKAEAPEPAPEPEPARSNDEATPRASLLRRLFRRG
jgi:hypothetical protein